MKDVSYGNRITDNTSRANDAKELVEQALVNINNDLGWKADKNDHLFSGVYYDSKKVGSFIIKANNKKGDKVVIKLQLQPLPFDEGFIIRHVEKENRSSKIRFPKVLADDPWSGKTGYGFVVYEDLSHMQNLWSDGFHVTSQDKKRHKRFLQEFLNNTLPITPFLKKPEIGIQEGYVQGFNHFYKIAEKSAHHHIENEEVEKFKELYFKAMDKCEFLDIHFTHAHLGGLDIKYDTKKDIFIPLANLDWSFRPMYCEVTFPTWNNLMHSDDDAFDLSKLKKMVKSWTDLFAHDLYDHDPSTRQQFWFNLLTHFMYCIMLDLGAGEWKKVEEKNRESLLEAFKEYFVYLTEKKFS